ncbi:MAG: hypothetical protein LBG74_00980, partial [Spirochaetaceae bacterium]|nr:hypothetical protein [Spirochaetaceae bacterium]
MKRFFRKIAPVFLAFAAVPAGAADLYSMQDGNWDDPSTWNSTAVPTATDNVEINHTITLNAAADCHDVSLYNGSLTIQSSVTLNVKGNILVANGTLIGQSSSKIEVDNTGTFTFNNNGSVRLDELEITAVSGVLLTGGTSSPIEVSIFKATTSAPGGDIRQLIPIIAPFGGSLKVTASAATGAITMSNDNNAATKIALTASGNIQWTNNAGAGNTLTLDGVSSTNGSVTLIEKTGDILVADEVRAAGDVTLNVGGSLTSMGRNIKINSDYAVGNVVEITGTNILLAGNVIEDSAAFYTKLKLNGTTAKISGNVGSISGSLAQFEADAQVFLWPASPVLRAGTLIVNQEIKFEQVSISSTISTDTLTLNSGGLING